MGDLADLTLEMGEKEHQTLVTAMHLKAVAAVHLGPPLLSLGLLQHLFSL